MTPEAQQTLLNSIAALLQDLQGGGGEDGEAMFLLGSAAANLVDLGKKANWRDFKAAQTPADVLDLMQQIDVEGPRMLRENKTSFAYAIQIVGLSLAACHVDNAKVQQGVGLLDDMIELTLTNFRNYEKTSAATTN